MVEAAPLLCAGITTFNPLKKFNVNSRSRIAIIGLGGLGHIAVQFAHAMGAQVIVFGHSQSKAKEALQFGASAYHVLKNESDYQEFANQFDLIINTTTVSINLRVPLKTTSSC